MPGTRTVTDAAELKSALDEGASVIEVSGTITGSGITLPPGSTLTGGRLEFGAKGVRLTRDNTLSDVEIVVSERRPPSSRSRPTATGPSASSSPVRCRV